MLSLESAKHALTRDKTIQGSIRIDADTFQINTDCAKHIEQRFTIECDGHHLGI